MLDPASSEGAGLVQMVKDRSSELPPLKLEGREVVLLDRQAPGSSRHP
jgi:hypothetical protein